MTYCPECGIYILQKEYENGLFCPECDAPLPELNWNTITEE